MHAGHAESTALTSVMSHPSRSPHLHINNIPDTSSVGASASQLRHAAQLHINDGSHVSHTHYASSLTVTLDVTSISSLPAPREPGQLLDPELLEKTLDNLSVSDELFMGKFRMLGAFERRQGGQGVVQFATHSRNHSAVAIKFFLNRKAFNCEEELYTRDDLKKMMPAITLIENNDSVRPPPPHNDSPLEAFLFL